MKTKNEIYKWYAKEFKVKFHDLDAYDLYICKVLQEYADQQKPMPRCLTCKHWKQNTFYDYDGAVNDGFCNKIESGIDIILKTGWNGGYVDSIETNSTFGCVYHNEV